MPFHRFRQSAKLVSARLRDQLVSKRDTAAYWVDYVIRNRGAPHLKSRASTLSWWQYHSVDVLAFLGTLASVVTYTLMRSVRAALSAISSAVRGKSKIQ